MPKCVKCNEFFPPNYVEIIEKKDIVPDENGEYPKHCIFCKLNIDEVERQERPGSDNYIKYTKKECLDDYKKFLRKMKENVKQKEDVKKILKGNPFGLK